MKIINLTQHPRTKEQKEAGVVDLEGKALARLRNLLTFDTLPTPTDIHAIAQELALLGTGYDAAMIGGAPWLIPPMVRYLLARDVTPMYAFSVRESEEITQSDGSVTKTSVFKHKGFISAHPAIQPCTLF